MGSNGSITGNEECQICLHLVHSCLQTSDIVEANFKLRAQSMFNRICRDRDNTASAEVNKRHLNVDYLKAQHQTLLTLQHVGEANEASECNRRLKSATSADIFQHWFKMALLFNLFRGLMDVDDL